MPRAAQTYCREPGCGRLVSSGYCDEHRRAAYQADVARRGSSSARGYGSARWRKGRAAFLNANPLCVACKADGRVVAATVVDHVVPHKGDQRLFWDRGNWQALCASCHSSKTAREDGGFGRAGKNREG